MTADGRQYLQRIAGIGRRLDRFTAIDDCSCARMLTILAPAPSARRTDAARSTPVEDKGRFVTGEVKN